MSKKNKNTTLSVQKHNFLVDLNQNFNNASAIDNDCSNLNNVFSDELYGFDQALSFSKNRKSVNFGSSLKKELNFSNFVVGKANEIAFTAAMQVSMVLDINYNPLFICGRSGLGKTHLMHAIGNYVIKNKLNSNVLYVTSERFVKDYVDSVRLNAVDEFQEFYRSVDILLVDDIQFIAGKSGSQEEFFHTFNTLLENKKQIVIACDKYPREIKKLEERLISRFGYGLVVSIDMPNLKTRTNILINKAQDYGYDINHNILLFIAKNICSNVRELEGALNRVLNYSKVHKVDVNEELVHKCLKDMISIQNKTVKIDDIQKIVANYYRLKKSDLLSKQKTRNIARPRQIAMTLSREFTHYSLLEIGHHFGGRDHTTVLHAIKTIKKLLITNISILDDYEVLSYKIIH